MWNSLVRISSGTQFTSGASHEWKEAKTVSWYQVDSRCGKEELHAKEIAYYTSLEPVETFGELLWGTGVHHQVDRSSELIFVSDGATWI